MATLSPLAARAPRPKDVRSRGCLAVAKRQRVQGTECEGEGDQAVAACSKFCGKLANDLPLSLAQPDDRPVGQVGISYRIRACEPAALVLGIGP